MLCTKIRCVFLHKFLENDNISCYNNNKVCKVGQNALILPRYSSVMPEDGCADGNRERCVYNVHG